MGADGNSYGFWGPITANIDWCESNYDVTYYIAEFWNTVSSLLLVAFAFVGSVESWRGRHVEFHYVLPFISLIGVGVGSVLFHMSLLYHLQLYDELPMIWGQASIFYAIQELYQSPKQINKPLAIALFFACLTATVTYLVFDDRLIFEGTYMVMVVYSIALLGFRLKALDRAALSFYFLAIAFYGGAVVFWLFDRLHCDKLQFARQVLHPTLQPFSQFHAIWHILVASGGHSFLLIILRARLVSLSKSYRMKYRFGVLPYYEPLAVAEEGKAK